MKNILHLIQTSNIGGAEKVAFNIVHNLGGEFKNSVGLLRDGWLKRQFESIGVEAKIMPSGKSFDVKLILNLIKTIKDNEIDLVHSHLFDMNFYSSIASHFAKVPHISTEHGDIYFGPKKKSRKFLIKSGILSHLSDRIVFVSESTKKAFTDTSPACSGKAVVIYNGVDFKEYETPVNIEKKRAEIGIRADEIVIGNVGNLYSARKGHYYMLQAAQKILKIFPKSIFIIIGDGPENKNLKNAADSLGIAEKVKFLGIRYDVNELLKIMDIFLLPSLQEALPVVIIEAMVNKIPVVSTDVGGIPEMITDGVDGLLIPPADSIKMAEKIIYLLKNRDFAHKLTMSGYEKAKKQFSVQAMVGKYEKLYSELIRT